MAPLLRFAFPSAPYACESFSRITENRDRSGVFLAHDLSACSVSHALDGFLLAKHRRFVSPDRHSWDFSPSELFPRVQPWRLPALVALLSLQQMPKQPLPPSGPSSARKSVGPARCFHRSASPMLSWGFLPFRAFTLPAVVPPSRNLLSNAVLLGAQSAIQKAAGLDKNFFVVAANHSHAQGSCCPTESQRSGRSACLSRVLPALMGFLAFRSPTRG